MNTDQEMPESQVETENEESAGNTVVEKKPHTELMEHEATIEELTNKLAESEQKVHDNWDKAVRIQAEMENLKKRTQKDLENAHKFALEGFAKELLVVLDSLVLGLQAAIGESPEVQKFREGSELAIKQFESALAKFNIVAIDPLGQTFNPELHQAMATYVVDSAEPNTVVNVFQKGYMLNGRLLRPAMVAVAKAAEKPEADIPNIDEQA
ncbi:Protein GrpE [Candidatus Methylobacter favarea]|uniref:Protein GrpE n=1 Tax=Candidatus Methylobacter favarea TaxID=2707345 RepID=A0A8S0WB97_9GAMM|nr:nucleotide exchange factor GrpE [Candidatus Methylobacter favarea]CAA9891543.1 Protein GrpE [Candidatus Methylobacter favarea]